MLGYGSMNEPSSLASIGANPLRSTAMASKCNERQKSMESISPIDRHLWAHTPLVAELRVPGHSDQLVEVDSKGNQWLLQRVGPTKLQMVGRYVEEPKVRRSRKNDCFITF